MRHDNFEVDSERFCQLCGISFNAGRIRRPGMYCYPIADVGHLGTDEAG